MDAVYTYVNGGHPKWQQDYVAARKSAGARDCSVSNIRCIDHGELALSIPLLLLHCPWIRHVYVVVAGTRLSKPTRAKLGPMLTTGRIRVIPQNNILPPAYQPCFSSCTVEAHLHRIPGLSPVFLYSNDDMMIGRPMAICDFLRGDLPVADVSLLPKRACATPANLAEFHCDNARRLFNLAFPKNCLPPCRVGHVPSLMCVSACEAAWEHHRAELESLCSISIRTDATVNFQLLAAFHAVHAGLMCLRGATHVRKELAWALVEAEKKGFAYILNQMPHRFCINGVDEESQEMFDQFSVAYMARVNENAYPTITVWNYATNGKNNDMDTV